MRCARPAICNALLAAAVFALAGCGVVRPSEFPAVCPSYEVTIRPIVELRCAQCHQATRAEGNYRVGAHAQTVSRSDDGTARVAPGNPGSPFLDAARGQRPGHSAIPAEDLEVLEQWVVRCRAAPLPHRFHPRGWATPTDSEQFHGVALRANFYNFSQCKQCHGADLRGGASQVDCNSCHLEGPTGCSTCHGDAESPAPPRDLNGVRSITSLGVGAHRAHVKDGPAHRAYGCGACHLEVKDVNDEGHFRRRGVFDRGAAEVILPSGPAGTAKWDRSSASCTNVYCHAPSTTDTAAKKKDPVWTRTGEATCGSCHGFPPSNHPPETRCELCHPAGYGNGGVDLVLHLNGKVDLRGGSAACDSCHAGPDSQRFFDLGGRSGDAGIQTVGAHDAHLHASRLRGPMGCNECHLVPDQVWAPGHLDTPPPAEVFPPGLDGLANQHGAVPVYNRANATCVGGYCHGGGNFGHPDSAPSLQRTPTWTGPATQVACGACHGLPPRDGTPNHLLALSVPCNTCHGGTVFADGGIILTGSADGGVASKHLDGRITGQ